MSTETKEVKAEPKFTPLHVNAHGYDSPYLVKAFIEDESGKPVCGLYEGDGAHARLFAAAPALYEALKATPCRYSRQRECALNIVDMCDRCAALALVNQNQETK